MKPKVKVRVWAGGGKKPPASSSAQSPTQSPVQPGLPASSSPARSSSDSPKSHQPLPQATRSPSKTRKAQPSGGTLLTMALLLGAIGLVGGGGWLAVRLIVDPASVKWLTALLPWGNSLATPPQTWREIAAEVGQTGQALGTPLYFSTYAGLTRQQAGFYDLLLPVVRPLKHCPTASPPAGCSQISELRVYRPRTGQTYDLLDRISITGPEELFVVAPLARSSAITQGTSRILPLTSVRFVEANPGDSPASSATKRRSGIWLQLSGEWQRGSRVLYGQVVQYDPDRRRLFPFQDWSSPPGQFPTWQQVTGDTEPELVVNQSVGLEPQFQMLQLKPPRSIGQTVSLEAVTLTEPASQNRTYLDGLLLARNGLWSPALALLQSAKSQMAKTGKWSASAQAQLDLIRLHAQVTQAQANRDWASPTQQILAEMTDGRWAQALTVLKQAQRSGYDVRNLLTTNSERLWQRVETALRVNAKSSELQTWGALLLAVRQNQQQALLWLQKQPNAAKHLPEIRQILAVLQSPDRPTTRPSPAETAPVAALIPAGSPSPSPDPALIGTVTPLATLQPQAWSTPAQPVALTLPTAESWYRVALLAGGPNSGQIDRWVADKAQLQLVVWQGANSVLTIPLTVRAAQRQNGQLLLLASGAALAADLKPTALVAVSADISWLQPTASLSLNQLAQRPVWQTTLIPQLWQELQTAQLVDPAADPLQTIGSWTAQTLELTGDQSPELMLTIQPEQPAHSSTPPERLHTVIFSDQALLYSDLEQPQQSLVAIAARTNALPALLVQQGQALQLWRWSPQTQRFEQE
ncbi:MAG: hypothetical protein ACKO7W_17010 [Elainella sp.]